MARIAKKRPYLWTNHLAAIRAGYLQPGTSCAVGFPTGAGKSTTAQLKIHAALLRNLKVVFLAPTHALVDQTARDLRAAFPNTNVKGQRAEEFEEGTLLEELQREQARTGCHRDLAHSDHAVPPLSIHPSRELSLAFTQTGGAIIVDLVHNLV